MAENEKKSGTLDNKAGAPAATSQKKEKTSLLSEISTMDGKSLLDYAVRKVLIPYGKKAIIEILQTYFNTKAPPSSGQTQKESYNDYFIDKSGNETPKNSWNRSVYYYENITFDRFDKASAVLSSLRQTLTMYGKVKVSDFYELADIPVTANDYSYGWTNLDGSDIVGGRGKSGLEYQLILPKAVFLK